MYLEADDRSAKDLEHEIRILHEEERWADALTLARSAVDRFPEESGLRLMLDTALAHRGSENAADQFRAAVQHAPDDGWVLVRAGNGMNGLSLQEEALEWCERAGDIVDRDHSAYPFLLSLQGCLSAWLGNLDHAELYLRHATALSPDSSSLWEELAQILTVRGDDHGADAALHDALNHGADPRYIDVVRTQLETRRSKRDGLGGR